MTERRQCLRAFAIGAVGYSAIELLYRRRTHWTMAVTGGLCFMLMHKVCRKYRAKPLLFKCAVGAGVITAIELAVGMVVNRVLKWGVWDYSGNFLNFKGQICPLFTGMWFLLGVPMVKLSGVLERGDSR